MGNAAEGSYLLRESESAPSACSLSLSVRCANSVKHYAIERRGDSYIFGHRSFETPAELSKHLGNFPALSGESGTKGGREGWGGGYWDRVGDCPLPRAMVDPVML